MSVVWSKVRRDLADDKGRTLLTVLSIAVGVFALGVIYGAYEQISDALGESHRAAIPVDITFWAWPCDWTVEDAVSRVSGVADVERQVDSYLLWKLEGETNWRDANLYARVDYHAQRMGLIHLLDGGWPRQRELAIERQSSRYFHVPLGTSIVVQVQGRERRVPVRAIVHDYALSSPQFGNNAAFYASPETIIWLTGEDYNRLDIRLDSPGMESATAVSEQIRDRLEGMGISVGGNWIRTPGEHWFQESVDTMLVILTALGASSLGMSAFLIVNTLNAVIAQQVWQIGVMKAVGATFGRVVRVYLIITWIYGLCATLLAVPLGAAGAHLLARWILDRHANILPGSFRVSPAALGIQFAVAGIVPPLAGLVPVLGGARISAHRAIRTYGLGGGFGRG
jgi:putative ABC transport system permease protein